MVLLQAVIVAYQPVWNAGFVWDDQSDIAANPSMYGLQGLVAIWTTSGAQFYPLTLTTFWLEHSLWGVEPLGYHLVNVLFHAATAILLWQVLRSLRVPGAWLGAALWALHPVQVESVAWVAETKNTQSAFFYLLTILFFLRGLRETERGRISTGRWNSAWCILCAAMAMASKSSTVILPLILCLCAWWMEGRWRWSHLVRIGPILLFSAVSSAMAMRTVQMQGVNSDPFQVRSWPERFITAGDAVWFYLGKLVWPHPLIAIYPRWQVDPGQLLSYLPFLAASAGLLLLWTYRQSWSRPYFFTFAYFLVALLPVLGLMNNYYQRYSFVADHYQYLADMGPLALTGAVLSRLGDALQPERLWLRAAFCGVLLFVVGALSWKQAWRYQSAETLWQDTLEKNPHCWKALDSLGVIYLEKGIVAEAASDFQKSMALNPTDPIAPANLGVALLMQGRVDEAVKEYKIALAINPDIAALHLDLGGVLLSQGQLDEALVELRRSVQIDPAYVKGHRYLGMALEREGRWAEAIGELREVLRLRPDDAEAQQNLQELMERQASTAK